MASCINYQLPDLLAQFRSIPLRTNKNCRLVTEASLRWISGPSNGPQVTDEELGFINEAKFSLLAALCFPTCDAPQLRLAMDFWTLFNIFLRRSTGQLASSWANGSPETALEAFSSDDTLKHLDPALMGFVSSMPSSWISRFNQAFFSFSEAQTVAVVRVQSADNYLELERDRSGLGLFVALVELVEGLGLSAGRDDEETAIATLRRATIDIILISWDIFSYNIDQANGNENNIVSILMDQNDIALHAAMSQAAQRVKTAFAEFTDAERHILSLQSSPEAQRGAGTWNPLALFTRAPSPAPSGWDAAAFHDVKLFIQGLKDCIVGALNWGYETELFFGDKGDEIREFGWVFLAPKVTK